MKYCTEIDPRIVLTDDSRKYCSFPTFVRFTGEFSEKNCLEFRQNLIMAENKNLECGMKVLPIIISSCGGAVDELMACIDAIEAVDKRLKIATIIEGKSMSCGAVLFTFGSEGYRFMGPNARLMIHEAAHLSRGKNEEVQASAEELKRLNERILEMMAINCQKEQDYFKQIIHERGHADWYLTAREALQHNIANKICIPKFKVSVKMDLEFIG